MRVGISGTPGTGKTTIAEELAKKLNYRLIKIKDFVEGKEIYEGYDEKRDTYIVNIERLNKYLKKEVGKLKNYIIEGHLAHFFKNLDLVIILRTNPTELKKRLEEKGWKQGKVIENVQAEILDIILQEAYKNPGEICEVETSKKSVNSVVQELINLIENEDLRKNYRAGRIDWSGYSSYF